MIRIIVDNDADLAALTELIEQDGGLPEVFYDSGYRVQREILGHLQTVAGGGKTSTVHVTADWRTADGGAGGTGTSNEDEPGAPGDASAATRSTR